MESITNNLTIYAKPVGSFLMTCGVYSFYWGILSGSIQMLATDHSTIQAKYSLPPSLSKLSHVVCAYDAAFEIIRMAITNGLIGLTWPISIPMIRYWYKKPIV
jgi:vacuolar-type H+-ATPase subunit I/STV1